MLVGTYPRASINPDALADDVDPHWMQSGPIDPTGRHAFSGVRGQYLWPQFDNLPPGVRLEVAYCLTAEERLGHPFDLPMFYTSLHVIRHAASKRDSIGRPLRSLLDLSVDEWSNAVLEEHRDPTARKKQPPVTSLTAYRRLHILARMMFRLDVRYAPNDWWERDLWDVDVDPRIPLDANQRGHRRRLHVARVQPEWLRKALKYYLRVGLESNMFRWRTAENKTAALVLWGRFLAERNASPLIGENPEAAAAISRDFVTWLRARPGFQGPRISESSVSRYIADIVAFYEFVLVNTGELALATEDARWSQVTFAHVAALKRIVPRRPKRQPANGIERGVHDRKTMTQLIERAPAIALDRHEHLDFSNDEGQPSRIQGHSRPDLYRLLMLLVKTGRRASEIRCLDFDCIVPMKLPSAIKRDASEGPVAYLRYAQTKIEGADDLCPIDAEAVQIIETQQAWAKENFPVPPQVLFPKTSRNRLGNESISYSHLAKHLSEFSEAAQLSDSTGNPVNISKTHRFRHTVATDLAASGVPISVLQRFMGHSSPEMSMHYVALHQVEQERAFLRFKKVDVAGAEVEMDRLAMFDVLSLSQKTNRILPNGLCLLPPMRDCDKGNACYSCSHFATDRSSLSEHLENRQRMQDHLDRWVTLQHERGKPVDEDNVFYKGRRQEIASLDRIIAALEPSEDGTAVRGAGTAGRADAVTNRPPVDLPMPKPRTRLV